MKQYHPLDYDVVNRAFSKQALHYDADDAANPILTEWRQQVYRHVEKFLKPESSILELNAGTGIDALHFVNKGHRVLATDLSDGMIEVIQNKIKEHALLGRLSCQQCSFEDLSLLDDTGFDYIFSNFGGLNCTNDLTKVTRHFNGLLKPKGFVTLVIMPPVCLWEWMGIFKGNSKNAFRRISQNGSLAHVEGEFFTTYYHSFHAIKKAMGKTFKITKTESLGLFSPPPSKGIFFTHHPLMHAILRPIDKFFKSLFPFNRCGDHIIVSFQKINTP